MITYYIHNKVLFCEDSGNPEELYFCFSIDKLRSKLEEAKEAWTDAVKEGNEEGIGFWGELIIGIGELLNQCYKPQLVN